MKRQKGSNTNLSSKMDYRKLNDDFDESIPMERVQRSPVEHTIEAQIQDGDTLQAIALRFNCTVSELKRLNKIEKEYEIYARKIIKVPITPHTLLLEHLPGVHLSGQSSPKKRSISIDDADDHHDHYVYRNGVGDNIDNDSLVHEAGLDDKKLKIAVANLTEKSINEIILNTEITRNTFVDDISITGGSIQANSLYDQLLSGELDDSIPQPRPILRRNNDFSCSGSDCDISWICLFICILALCFAIPLIYVLYIAEHLKDFQQTNSIDFELKNESTSAADRYH